MSIVEVRTDGAADTAVVMVTVAVYGAIIGTLAMLTAACSLGWQIRASRAETRSQKSAQQRGAVRDLVAALTGLFAVTGKAQRERVTAIGAWNAPAPVREIWDPTKQLTAEMDREITVAVGEVMHLRVHVDDPNLVEAADRCLALASTALDAPTLDEARAALVTYSDVLALAGLAAGHVIRQA